MTHLFYEIRDIDQSAMWGGEDEIDAVRFLKECGGSSIWVSEWEGEDENMWQTTKAIDVTALVVAVRYAQVISRLPL